MREDNLQTNSNRYVPRRRASSEIIPEIPGKTLLDFWTWAYSDIMENSQRGTFAEFLVACALGLDGSVRHGWKSYDLNYQGKKIEVKASGYVQSWHRPTPSKIFFGVAKRLTMDDETAAYGSDSQRIADAWVFALFTPKLHPAGDVIDPKLWEFYVASKATVDIHLANVSRTSLSTIQRISDRCVKYVGLKDAINLALEQA